MNCAHTDWQRVDLAYEALEDCNRLPGVPIYREPCSAVS